MKRGDTTQSWMSQVKHSIFRSSPSYAYCFLWAITEIGHHPSTLHAEINVQDVLIAPFTIVETVSLNCNVHPLTQQVTNSRVVKYSNADEL